MIGLLRRIGRFFVLAASFVASLVRANIELTRIIARPSLGGTAVLTVELRFDDPRLITLYSAMVTLTPGTLALALRDDMGALFVYALTRRSLDEVHDDLIKLQRQIAEVFT